MKKKLLIVLFVIGFNSIIQAQELPYLTTRSPITLVSTSDGEFNQCFQFKNDGTPDWELKTKDCFTVIHLGPNHPPIIKTDY